VKNVATALHETFVCACLWEQQCDPRVVVS
jgi:hypothetical protein